MSISELDKDNDGSVTRDEIKAALQVSGKVTDEKALDELMAGADADGDGKITRAEYLHFCRTGKFLD